MEKKYEKVAESEICILRRKSEMHPFEVIIDGHFDRFIDVNSVDAFGQEMGGLVSETLRNMKEKGHNYLFVRLVVL